MIARIKSFFQPQTQQQAYGRITGVLIGCIAVLLTGIAVHRYNEVRSNVYFSDGHTVLQLSADNTVTIYKVIK